MLLVLLLIIGAILAFLFLRNTMPTHGPAATMTRLWHRTSLLILGIKVHVHGERQDANVLFVPNHISWLDISILGALIPTHFLSKAEILYWPVIGMLASRTGTLYIQRGSRDASARSNDVMRRALEQQHNIVLFAEGTTTDGSMRKFHGRLMQSAIDAKGQIQPVALLQLYDGVNIFGIRKHTNRNRGHIMYIRSAVSMYNQRPGAAGTDKTKLACFYIQHTIYECEVMTPH